MFVRFVLVNVLVGIAIAAGWAQGLFAWVGTVPDASVRMLAFMGLLWLAGIAFVLRRRWRAVFHIAQALPMLGLCLTGIGLQIAGGSAASMSASASLAIFHALIAAMSPTFVGLMLMMHLRECAFWVGSEHV